MTEIKVSRKLFGVLVAESLVASLVRMLGLVCLYITSPALAIWTWLIWGVVGSKKAMQEARPIVLIGNDRLNQICRVIRSATGCYGIWLWLSAHCEQTYAITVTVLVIVFFITVHFHWQQVYGKFVSIGG